MKTFLLSTYFFFVSIYSYCQPAIEIKYQRFILSTFNNEDTKHAPIAFMPRMVFNDSFALVYFFSNTYNYSLPEKQIGHKLMHHGTFYNFITGEKFAEIKWPGKKKYYLGDTVISHNWQFINEERIILNKTCHAALSVNNNGDSTLVWYTNDLSFKKGPLFYDSIPGVVLEAFDQKRDQYFIASEINERKIKIVPIAEGTKLTYPEWQKLVDFQSIKRE